MRHAVKKAGVGLRRDQGESTRKLVSPRFWSAVCDAAKLQGVLPLLLLDVDGVLMPTGSSVPPGFERRSTEKSDIVVSRQHGVWLHELADCFELVWASTWGDGANEAFGEFYELPHLPSITLGELPRHGSRKLSQVALYSGERALAWVDDEIYDDARSWAVRRSAPTLLVRTNGSVGLRPEHYERLKRFGTGVVDGALRREEGAP